MERSSGTNAIGTALACEQAVHIEHDEHFLKANRFMTGSAAPIFDAERKVIAVGLDVLPATATCHPRTPSAWSR